MSERASPQRLGRTFVCYRIGAPGGEFPIYDARGSVMYPGRWNDAETSVIYASQYYSTAMLEKLAHGNGRLPPNQHYVEMTVPKGTSFEVVTKDHLPSWDTLEPSVSREFGSTWVKQRRSAILLVPSYVARIERNVVIDPAHNDSKGIEVGSPDPVWWDRRLFE